MDWNYILSLRPSAIDDDDKETLLNTIAWYDIDVEDVDLEKCAALFKISQQIMKVKSEQVEALVAELDELAKRQVEEEADSRSQRSKKSSSLDLDELEEKYRDTKQKLKQQNRANEKLKHETNKLNQQIKVLEHDRNHLQAELQSLQKDDTQSDLSENVRDQQRELAESVRQKNKHIAQLLTDVEALDGENVRLKERLANVRDKLDDATRQMNATADQLFALKVKTEEQREAVDSLTRRNESLKSLVEDRSAENDELRRQLEDFAVAIDRRADEWRRVLDEKNRETAEWKARVRSQGEAPGSPGTSDADAGNVRSEMLVLNKAIVERDGKLHELRRRLEVATEEMRETADVVDRMREEREASAGRLRDLKNLNRELKEKLRAGHSRCRDFQAEIDYLQGLVTKKDGDLDEILENLKKDGGLEIGDFFGKYQDLKSRKREGEKRIVELVGDVNQLQEGFEKVERENLELRSRLGLSEDEDVPTVNVLTQQRKQRKRCRDLQRDIAKLEDEKLGLRLDLQKQAKMINNLNKRLNELNAVPIVEDSNDLPDVVIDGDVVPKEEHTVVVEENEALRKGLHEIMDSLQNRKEKGYRDLSSEALEKLLKALDSKHIAGWYHSGMRLQAEIHSLEGCNKELREQLRAARLELSDSKAPTQNGGAGDFVQLKPIRDSREVVSNLNDILKEYNKQKEQNDLLVEKLEKYKTDFDSVQDQLVLLYREHDQAKKEWSDEKAKLSESADEVAEKVEVLERKLEEIGKLNLTADEETKVKRISEMAGQVVVLNRKCVHLENENARLSNDLDRVRNDLLNAEAAVTKKIKTMALENGSLGARIAALEVQLNNKIERNLFVKLQSDFDNLTIKHRELLGEVSKLRTNETNRFETTKRKVDILREEKETLTSRVQELTTKINSFEVSSFEIDKAVEVLTRKLSQSEINEIAERQRANHMNNLYELVKEQLRKSEERLHELERYNKEVMEKNLKLQETICSDQNKALGGGEIDAAEYDSLRNRYEKLLDENGKMREELGDQKPRFEDEDETRKLWASAREYELLSLRHQVLDLQAVTDDKAVISRLSSDVVHARLTEAEVAKKLERLRGEYERLEVELDECRRSAEEELSNRAASNEYLKTKIGDLQEIIIQQRHQYLGYVPLISETEYVENILRVHDERYRSFLNLQESENVQNEILIGKEQLQEQLKILEGIDNVDVQEKITKWYNEKSLTQLQELKHRRKAEFAHTQLEQAMEKIRMQDQHMSKLEEALFLAYQRSEVDVPQNLEGVKLKELTESEDIPSCKDISKRTEEKLKVYKSEETQTLFDAANTDQNDKAMKNLQKLESELSESQNQLRVKEESIEQLRSKATELEMNLSLFKTQLGDKQSQITFYEKHIVELQAKREILLEENEEYAALKAATARLQAVLLEREGEVSRYQSLLKRDRDEHSLAAERMQDEVKQLQSALLERREAHKEPGDAQRDGSPARLAIEQYIKQVHALERHTGELHTNLATTESQLLSAREECVRWRGLANDRLESVEKLRRDLGETHRNELKVYKDDCEKWRQEVLALKAFVSKFEGSTSDKSAELQKLVKDKDNRIHELTVQLRQLRITARKKPESTEISPHLQDIEAEREQQQRELEALKKKCENLLNKERNYREEIRNLKNQLMKRPTASARSDKSDTVKDHLHKKVSALEKENAELKENLQQQFAAQEAHRAKVAEDFDKWNKQKLFQQTAEKLRAKLRERDDELARLQQTCSGYRTLIERVEREKHALEAKNKNLRAGGGGGPRLEMLEIENARLQAEAEAAGARYEMAQHHSGALGAAMLQEKLEAQERKIAVLELAGKGSGELRNEIERLQSAVANLHKVNLRLEAENLEHKLDAERFAKEAPHLRDQIQYLENYVEVLKTENLSKGEPNGSGNHSQPESKKVSELERTVFVLKRIVEKLQAENKRLQTSCRICSDKTSDDALRRNFYKLKDQYGDSVQKIARLECELANAKLKQTKPIRTDSAEVEELKGNLEQKSALLEKVKILLHRAAMKEKALLEEEALSCKSSRTTLRSGKSVATKNLNSKLRATEDNRTLAVNSNCAAQILIDYVADEVQFDKEREFDFCDTDGEFVGILNLEKWENAKQAMPLDKTYVVVLIERNPLGQYKSFKILLNKGTELHTEMTRKLRKHLFVSLSKDRIPGRGSSKSTPRMLNFDKSPSRRRSMSSSGGGGSKSQVII